MKNLFLFILLCIATSAYAQRQWTADEIQSLYQSDLRQCVTVFNTAIKNACNGNAYIAKDARRKSQCIAEAERRQRSCETRAAATYEARIANLNRRSRSN